MLRPARSATRNPRRDGRDRVDPVPARSENGRLRASAPIASRLACFQNASASAEISSSGNRRSRGAFSRAARTPGMSSIAPITGRFAPKPEQPLELRKRGGIGQLVDQHGVDSLGQPRQVQRLGRASTARDHRDHRQIERLRDRTQVSRDNRTKCTK